MEIGRGLVVQSGADAGAWIGLRAPITFVGRGSGCDVRINHTSVRPLHCLLVPSAAELSVRSLLHGGVRVNGKVATMARLHDGDILQVGPVQWRIHWPAEQPPDDVWLESLRIQASAVVAQQSALFEKELSVTARAEALSRQETQLAERMESDRQELLQLQDQITQARASLREKRSAFVHLSAEHDQHLAAVRREVDDRRKAVERRESRIARLWTMWKRRARKQLLTQKKRQAAAQQEIQSQRDALDAQRKSFDQLRRQFHTRAELEKRDSQNERANNHQAKEAILVREQSLSQAWRELIRREKALAAAVRRHDEEQRLDQIRREGLRQELQALEARSQNSRDALSRQQDELKRIGQQLRQEPQSPPPSERAVHLIRVAQQLADRRRHLAELLERFVSLQLQWETDRSRAVVELDSHAEALTVRERGLNEREVELADGESQLETDRDALDRIADRIETDRLRAHTDVTAMRFELARLQENVDARMREAHRREQKLAELYQLWARRRSVEIAALRDAQHEHIAARDHWAVLRDTWLRARIRLSRDQQGIAARALALEEVRQEFVASAENPAVAARRMERSRRHWLAWSAEQARELNRLGAALARESESLDLRAVRSQKTEVALAQQSSDLLDELAAAERRSHQAASVLAAAEEQAASAAAVIESYEHQMAELRDQFDRLAGMLIAGPQPVPKAA